MVYCLPEPLPWAALATSLTAAEDALARLDERLATSPIRQGWGARTAFADACASLALQGDLVLLEDLVLHDAGRDRHAPTQELTRAHAVLRTRRRIAAADPGWATSPAGLAALSEDLDGAKDQGEAPAPAVLPVDGADGEGDLADVDDTFSAELADIDALIARSSRLLADTGAVREKSPLVYDPAWGETDRLAAWRHAVADTRVLPPVLAATIAVDAWTALEPLQHRAWLGPLLAADLLRARDKARHHLPALASALRRVPRDRCLVRDPLARCPQRRHRGCRAGHERSRSMDAGARGPAGEGERETGEFQPAPPHRPRARPAPGLHDHRRGCARRLPACRPDPRGRARSA